MLVIFKIEIFLFLQENICCGYSLEASHRDTSNDDHNKCFNGTIKKNNSIFSGENKINVSYLGQLTRQTY